MQARLATPTQRSAPLVLVDPLTELLNHRGFQERLRTALAAAATTRAEVSLALIDIDRFRAVNESAGHDTGDRVLTGITEQLLRFTRATDVLGRIGPDEFALLLSGCRGTEALAVIDRARAAIAATPLAGGLRITVSAGIAELTDGVDADGLIRLASDALRSSKQRGRDVAWLQHRCETADPSPRVAPRRLERSHALAGIRALARAIDAKDPSTRRHSDRVAVLARGLAETLGWAPDRVALLEEAALVHDVGKIGVPDAVLLKPGPLDDAEYDQMKQHALRGAEIVSEVLSPEQVTWIRGHHERPDGRGYPDGLAAEQIADGAAILAVGDAFDVMTMDRPYSRPKSQAEALAECRALVGRQFLAEPVDALVAMFAPSNVAEGERRRRSSLAWQANAL